MSVADSIDVVESGYEYLLAFAAQGREPELDENSPGPLVRDTLVNMQTAMSDIAIYLDRECSGMEFATVVTKDLRKGRATLQFVIDQARIGSEIIDNLNASIHLRTVLTDLFLIGESLGN